MGGRRVPRRGRWRRSAPSVPYRCSRADVVGGSVDLRQARARTASVIQLAQELVRRPSRGGIDDYGPVLDVLEDWLAACGLPYRRLHDDTGELVGLLVEIPGGRPGPWWALDACVDTAPYGDESAWSFPPDSAEVVDGWLLGRGAADSKLAAAVFCHIAADLVPRAENLHGGLAVLLDADEHTGNFGGARAYLADETVTRPAGVMIGYPGMDEVVVGGRGLWRATITVHAPSGHSGSSRAVVGAISRAAHLVRRLDVAELPGTDGTSGFPLPPKLSVTSFHGGQGFSATPDRCDLNVDIRTVPTFAAHDAEALVRKAVAELDAQMPAPRPTRITPIAAWPPFRLAEDEQPAAALLDAAAAAGLRVRAKTAGPSNIGNLLAGECIPATAGFGVPYEGLHGIDERADLAELPQVYAVYQRAVLDLLRAE
ncbi:peptidase dimerization protein [Streptomyces griseocarneus]|nr:peptidase dimerization protein [Streptomyces griseocarneus]